METVREKLVSRFAYRSSSMDAENQLTDATYILLRAAGDIGVTVDGWNFFKITEESSNILSE